MTDFPKLTIRVPDALTHNAEVLLDGVALKGLTRVQFEIGASRDGSLVLVHLSMYADIEAMDLSVVERVFASPEKPTA